MGGHKHAYQLSGYLVAAQFLSALLMMTCHSDRANLAIAKGAREESPDQMGFLPFYFVGFCIHRLMTLYPGVATTNNTDAQTDLIKKSTQIRLNE
ncbi:MAG: hypothetical protein IH594_18350 [Bacteroidales bacterium]|nr:hypothetical protein [Bacteroidales bacterium]